MLIKETTTGALVLRVLGDSAPEIQADDRTIKFKISTADKDRYGDVVHQMPSEHGKGWLLDNYIKGGSVLWGHGRAVDVLPVAKPVKTWVENNALYSVAKFPTKDEYDFADTAYKLIKGGYLKGTSVGFNPLVLSGDWMEGYHFWEQELIEYSITPTPVNPHALEEAKSLGIDLAPLGDWVSKSLDAGGSLFVPQSTLEDMWKICRGGAKGPLRRAVGPRFVSVSEEPVTEAPATEAPEAPTSELSLKLDELHKSIGELKAAIGELKAAKSIQTLEPAVQQPNWLQSLVSAAETWTNHTK